MTDEIEITLPASKKVVVIRNYTTREDDAKGDAAMYAGVGAKSNNASTKDMTMNFPLENILNRNHAYVYSMVRTVDGRTDTKIQLDNLRSEDYKAVAEAVEKIVDEHSPKAKEADSASKKS